MTAMHEALNFTGSLAFAVAVVFLILFVWAYAPTLSRAPSRIGATVMGGKLALLLLVAGSVLHFILGDGLISGVVRWLAIMSITAWLIYDYVIMRRLQAHDKQLSWWRRWLPFDNYKK